MPSVEKSVNVDPSGKASCDVVMGEDFWLKCCCLLSHPTGAMSEVRELLPEASASDTRGDTFKAEVSAAIKVLLLQTDLSQVSLGEFRASLAEHLGLENAVLEERKDEVNALVQAEVQKPAATPQQHMARIVEELGAEARISSTKSICSQSPACCLAP